MTGSPGFVTITYGSTYNAAVGLQCLASDTFRTESMKNVEFLYDNQCAPYQWSEAFEYMGRDQWVGMYLPQESYGNYESWGTSFSKQADTSGLRLGPCRRHRVPRQRPTAVMAERRLGDRMGQRQHQRRQLQHLVIARVADRRHCLVGDYQFFPARQCTVTT